MLKVVTVVGARPQFVKAAAISPLLRKVATEVLVHTGQHYNTDMSAVFFQELELPNPDYNLGIGSGLHGIQTGRMLEAIEQVLLTELPDWVLVYGDTNSTLAGALAATKMHIPVAHVEAGLRSFNRDMPEELNRVLTDHASDLLFAPTNTAIDNLSHEGLSSRTVLTGDVMADVLFRIRPDLKDAQGVLKGLGVQFGEYILLTLHRPSNVDEPKRLRSILSALSELNQPILFPMHPRTEKHIEEFGLGEIVGTKPFKCVSPLGYYEMLAAEANAQAIVTDSGGVQKEAYLLGVRCITLRTETEWVETVATGWNRLINPDQPDIVSATASDGWPNVRPPVFGDGKAAERIVKTLVNGTDLG